METCLCFYLSNHLLNEYQLFRRFRLLIEPLLFESLFSVFFTLWHAVQSCEVCCHSVIVYCHRIAPPSRIGFLDGICVLQWHRGQELVSSKRKTKHIIAHIIHIDILVFACRALLLETSCFCHSRVLWLCACMSMRSFVCLYV